MLHFIKLHYLSDFNYECRDALSDSYNEALKYIWKDRLSFFDELENELLIGWLEYEVNETYEKIFEIQGSQELGDNYYNSVCINFYDIPANCIDNFQEKFLFLLREKSWVVYKFEDSRFLEIRKQFFEDIYKIEMGLREAMSFIFLTTYNSLGNFLRDLNVGDITGKLWRTQDDLRNSFENEFFYISFKDYKNLLELKPIKELKGDIVEKSIVDSHTFDDWKRRIQDRGIREEPYAVFIESIKQDLSCLEKFRNAVMHNHYFNPKLRQEYEKSRDSILWKTHEFLEKHVHLSGNDCWLIPWKEYQCIWGMINFKKWKKYLLARIFFGDYMFIGEDGEEQWFRDKEFNEYFSY